MHRVGMCNVTHIKVTNDVLEKMDLNKMDLSVKKWLYKNATFPLCFFKEENFLQVMICTTICF